MQSNGTVNRAIAVVAASSVHVSVSNRKDMGTVNKERKLKKNQLKDIERLQKQSQKKDRECEHRKIRAFKLLADHLTQMEQTEQLQQLHELFPDISAAAETYVFKPANHE